MTLDSRDESEAEGVGWVNTVIEAASEDEVSAREDRDSETLLASKRGEEGKGS